MEMTTNVTILIPGKKIYYDYAIQMKDVGNNKASGQWQVINYMATPVRQGYSKSNLLGDIRGDAFLDAGLQYGFNLFLFKFGYLKDPILGLFNGALARIDMDVKQHIFSPGKESWAKKAELIPQMEELIAIFWE